MKQTTLKITNTTSGNIICWLTLGVGDSSVGDVNGIFGIKSEDKTQGSFLLHGNESVVYEPPMGICFNGNICFGSQPTNCPNNLFPNGVNLFEFNINNYMYNAKHKIENGQETIDISCVAGVNSLMKVSINSGKEWNASYLHPDVKEFENKGLYENHGQVGVYPYGCDICTGIKSPPKCDGKQKDYDKPQESPICNVQRDSVNYGGEVELQFMGYINYKHL
jgi:hypothetical protein